VLQWIVLGATAVLALMSWIRTRRLARRLDQLTQNYWDLRYQQGELRATVRRLDPEAAREEEAPAAPPSNFIPLSSLKRSGGEQAGE
jgi:hypothetical protein